MDENRDAFRKKKIKQKISYHEKKTEFSKFWKVLFTSKRSWIYILHLLLSKQRISI